MKQSDASAFVDESQQQAQQNQARFTTHIRQQQAPGSMTKKDIEAIKDPSERQAAIAQNIQLFQCIFYNLTIRQSIAANPIP